MQKINVKRHIFNYIADQHTRLDTFPTRSEVRKVFENLSEDVDLHLEQLQREGLLEFNGGSGDSISIPRTFPTSRRIELRNPLLLKNLAQGDRLIQSSVALDLRGAGVEMDADLFAHRVDDDSMIDAGICAGDVAILKNALPERGEIVAVDEAGKSVLRRYVIIADIPHFLAENPLRPDLTVAFDRPIHGVLWCLISTRPNGRGKIAPPIQKVRYRAEEREVLEAEFVAMLNSALREKPRKVDARQAAAAAPQPNERKIKTKSTVGKKSTRPARDWAAPPSGIALNDKGGSKYSGVPHRTVCDEKPNQPYGSAFLAALAQFSLETEQEQKT